MTYLASLRNKRNELVNGGLEVWQRGAGPFTANNAYTADRWQIALAGTDTISVSRESTDKKANSRYAAALTFTLGSGAGASRFRQRMVIADGYHHLLGQPISLRISVRASAANAVRAVITTDGSGGTSSFSGYHSGVAAFEELDVTHVVVPTNASFVEVGVTLEASATVYVDNAMLVHGPVAVDYQGMSPSEELDRCQRYYEVMGGAPNAIKILFSAAAANHQVIHHLPFHTKKAVIPTVSLNGAWALNLANPPDLPYFGVDGVGLRLTASAQGPYNSCATDSVDDTITAEANP